MADIEMGREVTMAELEKGRPAIVVLDGRRILGTIADVYHNGSDIEARFVPHHDATLDDLLDDLPGATGAEQAEAEHDEVVGEAESSAAVNQSIIDQLRELFSWAETRRIAFEARTDDDARRLATNRDEKAIRLLGLPEPTQDEFRELFEAVMRRDGLL